MWSCKRSWPRRSRAPSKASAPSRRRLIASSTWRRRKKEILEDYAANDREISLANSGALVAMDPNTGRVLGMVSYPDFDLSYFDGGSISNSDWDKILRGQRSAVQPRHLHQGLPRLHLQAVHVAGGPGRGRDHAGRAHRRRGRVHLHGQGSSLPSAGRARPRTISIRPSSTPSRTPATTTSTPWATASASEKLYKWAAALGLDVQDQHRAARRGHQLRGQPGHALRPGRAHRPAVHLQAPDRRQRHPGEDCSRSPTSATSSTTPSAWMWWSRSCWTWPCPIPPSDEWDASHPSRFCCTT